MKKVLLIASFFSISYLASAQCNTVGYSATGIRDDFSSATDPGTATGQGVYAWGEETLEGDDNPEFKAIVTRNATDGRLDVLVTQGQNGYVPFGIGFGDTEGDGTGTPYTLDLSGNGMYNAVVTNHSDPLGADPVTIKFRLTIQDINDNIIDTDPLYADDPAFGNAWKYTIEVVVPPGETKTIGLGAVNSGGTELSGTFTGGAYADYVTTPNGYNTDFDFTQVSSILFTVVNNENTGPSADPSIPGYQPLAIADVPVSIDLVEVGDCPVLGIAKSIGKNNTNLAPNPASSVANLTYNSTGKNVVVNVSDLVGNLVKTVNGNATSANFSVSDLTKGIYFVTLVVDGTPVSVEKLVVE